MDMCSGARWTSGKRALLAHPAAAAVMVAVVVVAMAVEAAEDTEVVVTSTGPVSGVLERLSSGEAVRLFLGIPYAEPPVGRERFKHATPKTPWKNTFRADSFGSFCVQLTSEAFWMSTFVNNTRRLKNTIASKIKMSEDCLTLNIYTPEVRDRDSKLPVLVFIHGGSYFMNSGNLYPGEKLASKGTVFVTINYRLGVFGFLSTGSKEAPGNYGLMDQILALTWIKENARHFGGDPSRITVSGNSAGAASVMLLTLSRYSSGLFQKVILLSGCSGAPWAIQRDPLKQTRMISEGLGCSTAEAAAMVGCLRESSTDLIMQNVTLGERFGGISFAPIVDGDILEDLPERLIAGGHFRDLPVMMGFTKQEVSSWFVQSESIGFWISPRSYLQVVIEEFLQHNKESFLQEESLPPDARDLLLKTAEYVLLAEYSPRTKNYKDDKLSDLLQAGAFFSDISLRMPCLRDLNMITQNASHAAYLFEFDYYSPDDIKMKRFEWIGAYHESEIQYILGEPFLNYENSLRTEDDKKISDTLMEMVINFINTGNPTPRNSQNLVQWTPYGPKSKAYMLLAENMSMKEDFFEKKMDFWNHLLPTFLTYMKEDIDIAICHKPRSWILWTLIGLCLILAVSSGFLVFQLQILRKKNKT